VGWKSKQLAQLAMDALQGKEDAAMCMDKGGWNMDWVYGDWDVWMVVCLIQAS